MDIVRVGLIGLGNMGIKYAKAISSGEVKGAVPFTGEATQHVGILNN